MTFFFNGGLEQAHEKEDRRLIPSPQVATYDLQPEMSAAGVAKAVSVRLGRCGKLYYVPTLRWQKPWRRASILL